MIDPRFIIQRRWLIIVLIRSGTDYRQRIATAEQMKNSTASGNGLYRRPIVRDYGFEYSTTGYDAKNAGTISPYLDYDETASPNVILPCNIHCVELAEQHVSVIRQMVICGTPKDAS